MNRLRALVAAASFCLAMCACSDNDHKSPAAHPSGGGSAAPVTPSIGAESSGSDIPPSYYRYDMSRRVFLPPPDCAGPSGPYVLHDQIARSRLAVLVTVTASGSPRWNTSVTEQRAVAGTSVPSTTDGARPTQAYVDALAAHPVKVNGAWPPPEGTATPYSVTVGRLLHGTNVPAHLTVYGAWGSVPGPLGVESLPGCATLVRPEVGKTYLLLLGAELTTARRDGPLSEPTIVDAMVYDGGLNEVFTPAGPQTP